MKNIKVIEELKEFIQEHYADPRLALELVAEQARLTSGYVGKLFKSVAGLSFNDYVTMIRMERAKTLLVETRDTVAQIGELVGIFNVSYFSTLFKKKYGITPSQFREQSYQGDNKKRQPKAEQARLPFFLIMKPYYYRPDYVFVKENADSQNLQQLQFDTMMGT